MQRNQSIEAYCPNIYCGEQDLSSSGSVPIRSRRHRRMVYEGRWKIGILSAAPRQALNPGDSLERGTYHIYRCPVCEQETYFQEKWGMIRPWG